MSSSTAEFESPVDPERVPAPAWASWHPSMENLFVGICGIIGAGKTTLATSLGKEMGLPVYYEPVMDNAYLADFYNDMAKYSFNLQVYLLNRRFQQHQQIIWQAKGGVQDRTIYEDSVFAKVLRDSGLMDERDYETYISLFSNMANFMRKPNLIVYLDVKPSESLERIKQRSRGCETGITVEYLENLYGAYETFITAISRVIPVIRVDWNAYRDTEDVARMIKKEWIKMSNVHYVTFDEKSAGGSSPSSPSS